MKTIIIYNPNSTGDSEVNAKLLAKELRSQGVAVTCRKTAHAGHAEEIAAAYAKKNEAVVLISSSGDGGYHEVINGVLKESGESVAKRSKLVVGLIPSGNANDHSSSLGSESLASAILHEKIRRIDTIQVSATVNGQPWVRYAHSYVGIGVTAVAAQTLTKERPNAFTEKWIVIRSLFSFNYVKVKEHRKVRRYSSLLFANIDRMSKVIKLSDQTSVTDGKFEMHAIRFRSKPRLLAYLLSAATIGLKQTRSLKKYTATVLSEVPIQLDGEVYTIDAGSTITVKSIKQNLRCIL